MGSGSGPKDHDFPEHLNGKGKADTTKVMSAIMSCWTDNPSDVVVHVWVEARDSLVEVFHCHGVPYDSLCFVLVLILG